jgi:ATP adenylyltransferase
MSKSKKVVSAEMKNLWAPWRIDYILGQKAGECVFCVESSHGEDSVPSDVERLILYRGRGCFVIMNKYPYCNGHIMVAPYAHVADISDLDPETAGDLILLVRYSASVLKRHFKTDGLNIGMNIGEAAGAGVGEHLHCHLVPRWKGDSNFMAVLADVRTIPQHLTASYAALRPYFASIPLSSDPLARCMRGPGQEQTRNGTGKN